VLTVHLSFFFFIDPSTSEIYTLSLHDALPICCSAAGERRRSSSRLHDRPRYPPCRRASRMPAERRRADARRRPALPRVAAQPARSEEHTSELQSRFDLVCRLLLEKKKTKQQNT